MNIGTGRVADAAQRRHRETQQQSADAIQWALDELHGGAWTQVEVNHLHTLRQLRDKLLGPDRRAYTRIGEGQDKWKALIGKWQQRAEAAGYDGIEGALEAAEAQAQGGGDGGCSYQPGNLDRTAPPRVWLQIDTTGDNDERDDVWPGPEHVTWQDESIGGLEIEYVRADLTAPPSAPVGVPADILRIVDTAIDVCNDRDRPAMAEDLEAVRLYVEQASAALAHRAHAAKDAEIEALRAEVVMLRERDVRWQKIANAARMADMRAEQMAREMARMLVDDIRKLTGEDHVS